MTRDRSATHGRQCIEPSPYCPRSRNRAFPVIGLNKLKVSGRKNSFLFIQSIQFAARGGSTTRHPTATPLPIKLFVFWCTFRAMLYVSYYKTNNLHIQSIWNSSPLSSMSTAETCGRIHTLQMQIVGFIIRKLFSFLLNKGCNFPVTSNKTNATFHSNVAFLTLSIRA
jgi:hypothetical protein